MLLFMHTRSKVVYEALKYVASSDRITDAQKTKMDYASTVVLQITGALHSLQELLETG